MSTQNHRCDNGHDGQRDLWQPPSQLLQAYQVPSAGQPLPSPKLSMAGSLPSLEPPLFPAWIPGVTEPEHSPSQSPRPSPTAIAKVIVLLRRTRQIGKDLREYVSIIRGHESEFRHSTSPSWSNLGAEPREASLADVEEELEELEKMMEEEGSWLEMGLGLGPAGGGGGGVGVWAKDAEGEERHARV
ncbi:hypothetical protein FRC12_015029 [Ceratobasidium sp. 428]|nr:hypothetical protein FRC12_015029 [Ceratobasidium sp. 428]